MSATPDRRPPALTALTFLPPLALWGWQTGFLSWALAMAAVLEAPRWVRFRMEIPQGDFKRLWNFTVLLFLGTGLYLFLAREGLSSMGAMVGGNSPQGRLEGVREISQTALLVLRCLPFVLFPFLAAFVWSHAENLPWFTFSVYEQARVALARKASPAEWGGWRTNPGYPFVGVTLFSSCTSVEHPRAFLPLFLAVLTWALWPWRSRRHGWAARTAVLVGLAVLTVVAQWGMGSLRDAWTAMEGRLMQSTGPGTDRLLRATTALGAVGRLKQSGRIVLRITTDDDSGPGLLRDAAFNRYRDGTWSALHRSFEPVGTVGDGGYWRVAPGRPVRRSLRVSRYTASGEAPLSLAGDVIAVRDLPFGILETNALAAARLRDGPALLRYRVDAGPGGGFDGPPEPLDTDLDQLLESDRAVILNTARRLGLPGMGPEEAVRTVEQFFREGFEYSLWQREAAGPERGGPLAVFLQETRAGHCEFFATATTLLLRTAGVPARYAVGFSPEDRRGAEWLARGRDAHAWCLAYVQGRWMDVDTTPGIWRDREAQEAGWWEGATDLLSQAWYRFSLWRQQSGAWQLSVFVAGMLVLSWMGWRQLRGSRWRRARAGSGAGKGEIQRAGLDSEFFAVTRKLESVLGPRLPHESLSDWIRRLGLAQSPEGSRWQEALRLHSRLRFDPAGLADSDRERLRTVSADLLRRVNGVPRLGRVPARTGEPPAA